MPCPGPEEVPLQLRDSPTSWGEAAESTKGSTWGKVPKKQGQGNKQEAKAKSPLPRHCPCLPSCCTAANQSSTLRGPNWDSKRYQLQSTSLENDPLILSTIQQINAVSIGVCSHKKNSRDFAETTLRQQAKGEEKAQQIKKLFRLIIH